MNPPYCRSLFLILIPVLASRSCVAVAAPIAKSIWAETDVSLNTNPESQFWCVLRNPCIWKPILTAILCQSIELRCAHVGRLRISTSCLYEQLNLRPNPKTSTETYGLWNWDVAEVFIGADFKDVKPYKEFEISPRENGQTWILISINRITRKVGPGIPASRFRHESTLLLAFGTAQ